MAKVFFSYSTRSDELSDGALRELRAGFQAQLELVTGLRNLTVFLDQDSIPVGARWEERLDHELDNAAVFVAVLEPLYVQSPWCRTEFRRFALREQAEQVRAKREGEQPLLRLVPILWRGIKDLAHDGVDQELREFVHFAGTWQHLDLSGVVDQGERSAGVREEVKRLAREVGPLLLRAAAPQSRPAPGEAIDQGQAQRATYEVLSECLGPADLDLALELDPRCRPMLQVLSPRQTLAEKLSALVDQLSDEGTTPRALLQALRRSAPHLATPLDELEALWDHVEARDRGTPHASVRLVEELLVEVLVDLPEAAPFDGVELSEAIRFSKLLPPGSPRSHALLVLRHLRRQGMLDLRLVKDIAWTRGIVGPTERALIKGLPLAAHTRRLRDKLGAAFPDPVELWWAVRVGPGGRAITAGISIDSPPSTMFRGLAELLEADPKLRDAVLAHLAGLEPRMARDLLSVAGVDTHPAPVPLMQTLRERCIDVSSTHRLLAELGIPDEMVASLPLHGAMPLVRAAAAFELLADRDRLGACAGLFQGQHSGVEVGAVACRVEVSGAEPSALAARVLAQLFWCPAVLEQVLAPVLSESFTLLLPTGVVRMNLYAQELTQHLRYQRRLGGTLRGLLLQRFPVHGAVLQAALPDQLEVIDLRAPIQDDAVRSGLEARAMVRQLGGLGVDGAKRILHRSCELAGMPEALTRRMSADVLVRGPVSSQELALALVRFANRHGLEDELHQATREALGDLADHGVLAAELPLTARGT